MPTPAEVREQLRRAEAERQRRRLADAQDHFERTWKSAIVEGREVGTVLPTRQTAARLRPDPLVRLVATETLSRERAQAAVEIREVYERVSGGLLSRASDMGPRVSGGRASVSDRIASLHASRYLPWARYLGGAPEDERRVPAFPAHCPPALTVAIDVAVFGMALRNVDRERRWRRGTATDLLVYALGAYTDLAGWERNRDELRVFEEW